MISRTFRIVMLLLSMSGLQAQAEANGGIYPIQEGMARLIIARTDEPLLYRQDAVIALNGRPVGNLASGASIQMDLAPGTWRVSASARSSAEHALLTVVLKRNAETRVHVAPDPARFSSGGGFAGLTNLVRQSLDAPNDDRLPLFRLRQIVTETPEGER